MKNYKEYLVGIGFILGVGLISTERWILGGIVLFFCIEQMIKLSSEYGKKDKYCYRLRVNITPNYQALLGIKPEERSEDWKGLYRKMLKDKDFEYDEETSLIGKSFSFTVFVDERSGMKQIYDNNNKCFVNDMEVVGRLVEYLGADNVDKIAEKYGYTEDALHQEISFSPFGLSIYRRDEIMPEYQGTSEEGDHLSVFPFYQVVKSFRSLFSGWGSPMCEIFEFPKDIQELLNKAKATYIKRPYIDARGDFYEREDKDFGEENKKLYKKTGYKLTALSKMHWHTFETEYLQVSINLKRLDGYNLDWDLDFSNENE